MNINYGLLPPMETPVRDERGERIPPKARGRAKKRLMSLRAMRDLRTWLGLPEPARPEPALSA